MEVTISTEKATCECGRQWDCEVITGFPRQKLCPTCCQEREDEAKAAEFQRKTRERWERWKEICPPLYQATDLAKIGIGDAIKAEVMAWEPNPTGLALVGRTGAGKTRLAYKLMDKVFFSGLTVMCINAKQFERWCSKMFDKDDDASKQLNSLRRAKVIFIDDVGKEKFTERVESELYDLVETRTANLLPIIWTSNATATRLKDMLSPDRGEPIIRRLKEFSTIIPV